MTYFFLAGLAIAAFAAGYMVKAYVSEDSGPETAPPTASHESMGRSDLKKPWIVYDQQKAYCVIPAHTLEEAHEVLKFQTGRFTFSLRLRESNWGLEEAIFLPLHADWVRQMDAESAERERRKVINSLRDECPVCGLQVDHIYTSDGGWEVTPHPCPGQPVLITSDALDDLADKVVSIFEAENAARATATGTAVGDDGPVLDGEVA